MESSIGLNPECAFSKKLSVLNEFKLLKTLIDVLGRDLGLIDI